MGVRPTPARLLLLALGFTLLCGHVGALLVDAWEGSLRRGFVACLERERKKEMVEATMTGGCGRLLSTEAVFLSSLSPLSLSSLSLSRTSDASSPLLVSLPRLSLCEHCRF